MKVDPFTIEIIREQLTTTFGRNRFLPWGAAGGQPRRT